MPKSDNQKLKIFYILDYLQKNSRQDKPVGAQELISMLDRQHNISCDRKTVYSDVKALQDYITRHCYTCTPAILAGLGQMYVADDRFRANIDKHGDGTAAFISEAIAAFCQ